jgi:hypothetical protein
MILTINEKKYASLILNSFWFLIYIYISNFKEKEKSDDDILNKSSSIVSVDDSTSINVDRIKKSKKNQSLQHEISKTNKKLGNQKPNVIQVNLVSNKESENLKTQVSQDYSQCNLDESEYEVNVFV